MKVKMERKGKGGKRKGEKKIRKKKLVPQQGSN